MQIVRRYNKIDSMRPKVSDKVFFPIKSFYETDFTKSEYYCLDFSLFCLPIFLHITPHIIGMYYLFGWLVAQVLAFSAENKMFGCELFELFPYYDICKAS